MGLEYPMTIVIFSELAGEKCIETSSVSDNFICMTPNTTSSIVVGGASVDVGQMSDLAQAFIERSLVRHTVSE